MIRPRRRALDVGLVLDEEEIGSALGRELVAPERRVLGNDFMAAAAPRYALSLGLGAPTSQSQVLRNQSVGNRCSSAASGPRFAAVIRTRTSSMLALAYSTVTSQ